MRRLLASIVCVLMLAACSGAPAASAQSAPAQDMIRLVNDFRAANGMPALEADTALMAAAQRHADWQAATHNNYHQGEGGSMPWDRAEAAGYRGWVSENVASGTVGYVSPEWAVNDGWANSSIHREAMLSQNVHVGAGVAQNEDMIYYVLLVGSPSSGYTPPAPGTPRPAGSSPTLDGPPSTGSDTGGFGQTEIRIVLAVAAVTVLLAALILVGGRRGRV